MFSGRFGEEYFGIPKSTVIQEVRDLLEDGDLRVHAVMNTYRFGPLNPLKTRIFDMRTESGEWMTTRIRELRKEWSEEYRRIYLKLLSSRENAVAVVHTHSCLQGGVEVQAQSGCVEASPRGSPLVRGRRGDDYLDLDRLGILRSCESLWLAGLGAFAKFLARQYGLGDTRPPRVRAAQRDRGLCRWRFYLRLRASVWWGVHVGEDLASREFWARVWEDERLRVEVASACVLVGFPADLIGSR